MVLTMDTFQEILKRNPKVDQKLTSAYAILEIELRRLGVEVKPKFTVSPALGGTPISQFSSNANREAENK
jgi:hypothetical protein